MLTGTYVAGDSPLHRAPPGLKVAVLAVLMLLLVALGGPVAMGAAALLVTGLYALARIPARVAWAQVWPLRWFVLLLVAFQLFSASWVSAVVVCANLVVAVAAASLVTLTTRVEDMRESVTRALVRLRRLGLRGIDPERAGLLIALTIRSIPVIVGLSETARQARVARGLERSVRAFVTPLVVRTVRHADRVGEALIARGVDD
ncbi:MAG: energy-coupling factor transporter transmembrane protein EcfT [Dermatophilaceae bacterium]